MRLFLLPSRKKMLLFCLVAVPLLVGSSCAFFFSSGGGSSDKDDRDGDSKTIVVVNNGHFGDPAIAGVNYESGSLTGVTGPNGEFQYEPGKTVHFAIGDISLGPKVIAKDAMTPGDLVAKSTVDKTRQINILRLLQSLDSVPDDDVITIPDEVRSAAVSSNEMVFAAIEHLDFSDDTAFVNAAGQLVAALTADYPFTAMLVDADEVVKSPVRSIDRDTQ